MTSTSTTSSSQQIPADFGSRFSAFMIDAGLLFAGQWTVVAVLSRTLQAMGMTSVDVCSFDSTQMCEGPHSLLVLLLAAIVIWSTLAYHALFEGMYGATPGKHWMGLRVESTDGSQSIGLTRSTIRSAVRQAFWIVLFLSLSVSQLGSAPGSLRAALFLLLPVLALGLVASAAFTKDNRGVHDRAANTIVVRRGPLPAADATSDTGFQGPLWSNPDQPEDLPEHFEPEDVDLDLVDESPDDLEPEEADQEPHDRDREESL